MCDSSRSWNQFTQHECPLIPVVKKRLSEISLPDAKILAQNALNATSPEEVRNLIRECFPDTHSKEKHKQ